MAYFEPNPKNPIIASFFRNIALADELGFGVRNLYRYVRRYSSKDPKFVDVAKEIGKSRRAVQNIIATLKEKGLLERKGAKRNGKWIVL